MIRESSLRRLVARVRALLVVLLVVGPFGIQAAAAHCSPAMMPMAAVAAHAPAAAPAEASASPCHSNAKSDAAPAAPHKSDRAADCCSAACAAAFVVPAADAQRVFPAKSATLATAASMADHDVLMDKPPPRIVA